MKKSIILLLFVTLALLLVSCEEANPGPYTVAFHMKGHGTQVDTQVVKKGDKATEPTVSGVLDYILEGWYTSPDFNGETFDFNQKITRDTVLYAKWRTATETEKLQGKWKNVVSWNYEDEYEIESGEHFYVKLENREYLTITENELQYCNILENMKVYDTEDTEFETELSSGLPAKTIQELRTIIQAELDDWGGNYSYGYTHDVKKQLLSVYEFEDPEDPWEQPYVFENETYFFFWDEIYTKQ